MKSVMLINPETDGAMPAPCTFEDMGSKIKMKINGNRGLIVVVEKSDLESLIYGREEYPEIARA